MHKKNNHFVGVLILGIIYNLLVGRRPEDLIINISLIFAGILIVFYFSKNLYQGYYSLKPSFLFLIGYWGVFMYAYYIVANKDFLLSDYRYDVAFSTGNNIGTGCILATNGIWAFFLGYVGFAVKANNTPLPSLPTHSPCQDTTLLINSNLYSFANIAYITIFALMMISDPYQAYGVSEASRINNLSSSLFRIFFYAMLIGKQWPILQCAKKIKLIPYIRQSGLINFIFLIVKITVSIISGDRGPLIELVGFYFAIFFWVNRVAIWKTFIVGIVVFYFLAVLSFAREDKVDTGFFSSFLAANDSLLESDVMLFDLTRELSGSVAGLHHFLENIPNRINYYYGYNMLYSCSATIPGFNKILDAIGKSQLQTSDVLSTFLIQGRNSTYGNGSNIIADFYIDGGVVFVMLGMFGLGFMCSKIDGVWVNGTGNIYMALFVCLFVAMAIYMGRSAVWVCVRPYVQSAILVYFLYKKDTTRTSLKSCGSVSD